MWASTPTGPLRGRNAEGGVPYEICRFGAFPTGPAFFDKLKDGAVSYTAPSPGLLFAPII